MRHHVSGGTKSKARKERSWSTFFSRAAMIRDGGAKDVSRGRTMTEENVPQRVDSFIYSQIGSHELAPNSQTGRGPI